MEIGEDVKVHKTEEISVKMVQNEKKPFLATVPLKILFSRSVERVKKEAKLLALRWRWDIPPPTPGKPRGELVVKKTVPNYHYLALCVHEWSDEAAGQEGCWPGSVTVCVR